METKEQSSDQFRESEQHDQTKENASPTSGLWKLVATPVLMFGFGFAMIPLYDVFCDITGLNGKTSGQVRVADLNQQVSDRSVKLQFTVHSQGSKPWQFYPSVNDMDVKLGELNKTSFKVKSMVADGLKLQAIPSVSPSEAAVYLHKTECFCFRQQDLAGQELKDMPLVFQIDPELPDHITKITLSYTLYNLSQTDLAAVGE